jgi:hypothetical protein
MDVVAISTVAVVRVDVPRGRKVDRMAMRRSKICPPPSELARLHRFRRGEATRRNNFLQRRQELSVVGKFCILVGTLRGCSDLCRKGAHPIVPREVAFALQQHREREGLGLPRLPGTLGLCPDQQGWIRSHDEVQVVVPKVEPQRVTFRGLRSP